MATNTLLPGHSRLRIIVASLVVCALVVGGLLYLTTKHHQGSAGRQVAPGPEPAQVAPGVRPFSAIFDPSQPLLIPGSTTTFAAATAAAGFPVVLPQAEATTSSEVWFSPSTDEVGIRYGSSLVVLYSAWPSGMDPAQTYAKEATDWAGSTTTINNNQAWIIPPDAQAPGLPPASVVDMAVGGVEIKLFGLMPLNQLVSIASSIQG